MSQQHMDFEESSRGYQAQAPYPGSREGGSVFDDAFSGTSGQKLGQYSFGGSASAGQRLALAIVSLCLLVPLSAIILGIATSFQSFGIIWTHCHGSSLSHYHGCQHRVQPQALVHLSRIILLPSLCGRPARGDRFRLGCLRLARSGRSHPLPHLETGRRRPRRHNPRTEAQRQS